MGPISDIECEATVATDTVLIFKTVCYASMTLLATHETFKNVLSNAYDLVEKCYFIQSGEYFLMCIVTIVSFVSAFNHSDDDLLRLTV